MPGLLIPPWLNADPAAPAHSYLQAYGQGAQIGQANRANERSEAEMAFSQEQAAIKNDQSERQMQIQKEQAERAARLRETAQEMQMAEWEQKLITEKDAAERARYYAQQKLEGQTAFQDQYNKLRAEGVSEDEAARRALLPNLHKILIDKPEALGPNMRAINPPKPVWVPAVEGGAPGHFEGAPVHIPAGMGQFGESETEVVDLDGEKFGRNKRTGALYRLHPSQRSNPVSLLKSRIGVIKDLLESPVGQDPAKKQALTDELDSIRDQMSKIGQSSKPANTPTAPIPLPKQKSSLIKGKAYINSNGQIGIWTGSGFSPLEQPLVNETQDVNDEDQAEME